MLFTVLYKFLAQAFSSIPYHTDMRRSHLLPDQLHGEHTDLQGTHLAHKA